MLFIGSVTGVTHSMPLLEPHVERWSFVVFCTAPVAGVVMCHPVLLAVSPVPVRGCLVPWSSIDIHEKFYGDRLRGTPPTGELNARGVAKYNDFGHIEWLYLGYGAI